MFRLFIGLAVASGLVWSCSSSSTAPRQDNAPRARYKAPKYPETWPAGSPQAVAKAALEALRRADLDALAALATSDNRKMLPTLKPGSSRYESLFGKASWRQRAVRGWGSRIDVCLKHQSKLRQRCVFDGAQRGEIYIVQLDREQGQWRFDDLLTPTDAGWVTTGNDSHNRNNGSTKQ